VNQEIDDPRLPPPLPAHVAWAIDPHQPVPTGPEVVTVVPLTVEALLAAGVALKQVQTFLEPLNAACVEFDITTPQRASMFLSQVAWESGMFRYLCEIWGPSEAQLRYPGGRQWSGHGLIQITGEANHREQSEHFGIPMSEIAAWLQTTEGACRSAGLFWQAHHCSELADVGNFSGVTKRINGGYTDLDKRMAIYKRVAAVMGVAV
jgi:putative chitinase